VSELKNPAKLNLMREPDIELTEAERGLFDQIEFDQDHLSHKTWQVNAPLVEQLFDLLNGRGALPAHRLKWFTDADFNPGGRGRSREDQWRQNGTSGREILRHPNFLSYISYFICGPDLPPAAARTFRTAVENCGMVTSGDMATLSKVARALARQHGLGAHAASDEFYKLALDCGLGRNASYIRDGVRSLR
jgi:hypothetical protein